MKRTYAVALRHMLFGSFHPQFSLHQTRLCICLWESGANPPAQSCSCELPECAAKHVRYLPLYTMSLAPTLDLLMTTRNS